MRRREEGGRAQQPLSAGIRPETRRELIVAHYLPDDPAYLRHLYSFDDSILLLLENGGDQVFVTRVNKNTGQETAHLSIPAWAIL